MRDLAFYILEKDCGAPPAKQLYFYRAGQNLEEIPKDCTAISEALRLSLDTNKLERLPESFYAPKLVSLLLGGNPIQVVPESFLSNFPKLKVLDLRNGQFDSLPDELGDLTDLVCLDLSHCVKLNKLPEMVGKLHVLKCLVLCYCWRLEYLPSGVANLTSLQVLHTENSQKLTWSKHTSSGMQRAESLRHADPIIRASLEDICRLMVLTQVSICGRNYRGILLRQMSDCFKQLQELDLSEFRNLKSFPKHFTCAGAFPSLTFFKLSFAEFDQFPEVEKGALPKF
jgi:Leucine-rich repeat (LRR) protein